jgi:hypothetical protein
MPRWRLQIALVAIGIVAGIVVTVWDYATPTRCAGPLACIDYTGVASLTYWVVFGIQALVSTAAMHFVRSSRRFFMSHVTAAGTLLACISLGWIMLIAQPAHRRFAASGAPTSWTCPAEPQTR